MPIADDLADEFTARDLQLNRLAESERRKIFSAITKLEGELIEALRKVDPTKVARETFRRRRMKALLDLVSPIIRNGYGAIGREQKKVLRQVARLEADQATKIINNAIGFDAMNITPEPETLRALADDTLVEGAVVQAWWKKKGDDTREMFANEMRAGLFAQEDFNSLMQRVRGTRANRFQDGITGIQRRSAERIVRTSVNSVSNNAREQTFSENEDIMKGVQALATLDTRTSPICMARAGSAWNLNTRKALPESPRKEDYPGPPPWHWRCRTVMNPVLKSYEDLLGSQGKQFDKALEDLGPGTRSSMDGQIAGDTTFHDWFERQGEGRQKTLLGAGRLKLYQDGKLKLKDLVDQRGHPLTIDQLMELGVQAPPIIPPPRPPPPVKGPVNSTLLEVFQDEFMEAAADIPELHRMVKEFNFETLDGGPPWGDYNPLRSNLRFSEDIAHWELGDFGDIVQEGNRKFSDIGELWRHKIGEVFGSLDERMKYDRDQLAAWNLNIDDLLAHTPNPNNHMTTGAARKQRIADVFVEERATANPLDQPLHRLIRRHLDEMDSIEVGGIRVLDVKTPARIPLHKRNAAKPQQVSVDPLGAGPLPVDVAKVPSADFRRSIDHIYEVGEPKGYDPGRTDMTVGAKLREEMTQAVEVAAEKEQAIRDEILERFPALQEEKKQLWARWEQIDAISQKNHPNFSQAAYDEIWGDGGLDDRITGISKEIQDLATKQLSGQADLREVAIRSLRPAKAHKLNSDDVVFKDARSEWEWESKMFPDGSIRKVPDENLNPGVKGTFTEEAQDLYGMISEDVPLTERAMVQVQGHPKDYRANYKAYDRSVNMANHSDSGKVMTHELGHQLEYDVRDKYGNATWQLKANRFLEQRTEHEVAERFIDIYPNSNYTADEIFKRDKWEQTGGTLYSGKVYDIKSTRYNGNNLPPTEIISMGVERLMKDPSAFATSDPEYFDFIVSLLNGG